MPHTFRQHLALCLRRFLSCRDAGLSVLFWRTLFVLLFEIDQGSSDSIKYSRTHRIILGASGIRGGHFVVTHTLLPCAHESVRLET